MVFVTNNTDAAFEDGYAGEVYKFLPGKPLEISVEAARHIFGYEDANKEPYLIRLGWTMTRMDMEAALEKLSKFVITEENPKKHHSLSPVVERVPLTPKRGGGKLAHIT
jgi:hypothetical protein